ncbi:hypothetical protein LZZ90_00655 [Flavobacterium sp. SM15]|uniref:hypothetical protein n=1 Tax=Flavobacterium sp. SM15 TaxID=2908005 RepID=UPI001EDA1863|nr:hypothetical protein [Flavobacterium sp. SM15]MCG2610012.1 hypothetical protein [Flavobacterium sp. SM15]
MNAKEVNIFLRNNTGNKAKEALIDGFVIRTKVFNNIFSEIMLSKTDKPEQNYLVIGQRGAGKTTLLYRLKYAIEDEPKLSPRIIPIMFSEEQYNLMDLINLWESIAEHLEEHEGFEFLQKEITSIDINHSYREEEAYELIEKKLSDLNKKVIIFIENIDVFFKKIGKNGQKRLREVLTTSKTIRLICSSTTYFEGIINYTDPFYEFFKIIQLDGLNRADSVKLLGKLAEQRNQTLQIEEIINNYPKRLESLRRLTGGNPRIISYLFQIFLDNEDGRAIIDLYKLLDDITYLYKAELDQLSAQQQKIVDSIARNWDAISTKEISQKTNIDSKHISSILNTLEKNQIVESVSTRTKNNLYRLKDRFLNIWYLMRFGKKREKENVIWLVRFFDTWCDQSELSKRIDSHIMNLKAGKYDVIAALDMGNVFLSCENVPHELKYNLYQTTKSVLPKQLMKDLIISDDSLGDSIRKLVKQKDWEKAIEALTEIKSTEKRLALTSWIYLNKGEVKTAIDSLEELYKISPDGDLASLIGDLYKMEHLSSKAIYYYNEALKYDIWISYHKLGGIYSNELGNFSEAEKYYNLAIEHNIDESLIELAEIYFLNNQLTQSQKLIQSAIVSGKKDLKSTLAAIFMRQDKIEEAISTLEEAIKDGEKDALLNLGKLYLTKDNPEIEKAKEIFENAIKKETPGAYNALAKLYLKQDNKEEAEKALLKGIEKHDAESAHLLAHLYIEKDNWKKGEQFFLKSIKWGKISSIMCLAESVFFEKKNEKREFILNLFEKHYPKIQIKPAMVIGYARFLLWDDQIEKSINIIKQINSKLINVLEKDGADKSKENIIDELTVYLILLISKGQLNIAYELFSNNEFDYKQILKPVYYALMNYMKDDYPNEYLKAGNELKETIDEIIEEIENFKKNY